MNFLLPIFGWFFADVTAAGDCGGTLDESSSTGDSDPEEDLELAGGNADAPPSPENQMSGSLMGPIQ